MKFIKIVLLLVFLYTIYGIPLLYASSIDPAIQRVTLAQGQKKSSSVTYTNTEDSDIKISITPYSYNPKTDEISQEKKYIFLKADTDTITVKAKSSYSIKYEIFPLINQPEGSYFNILALTPVIDGQNIEINMSIAQLVILDIVDVQSEVQGVTTTLYTTQITKVKKGIPFISPLQIRYKITNNSNYLLTPSGRIDVFNEKNSYKPIYVYINEEEKEIYPGESIEKVVKVEGWHITDLFLKRVIMGEIYNGIDNKPQYVETEINSFSLEIILICMALFILILPFKSFKQKVKPKKEEESLKHT